MSVEQFTGLREQTRGRFLLDAGACYLGINEEALRTTGIAAALSTPWTWQGQAVTPRPLGATRGGATFDPQKEERQIEVDNVRVPLLGLDRVDMFTPILSVTLLELADIETIKLGLGQADVTRSASGYDEVVPRVNINLTDYLPNIAMIIPSSEDNQAKPAVFVIRNCKVVENSSIPFEDPGEAAMEVSFRAGALFNDARTVPCSMYLPVPADGLGSGS